MIRTPAALIPYVLALATVLGGLLWHAGDLTERPGQVVQGTTASVGGPFALIDQYGHARTEKDYAGRYMLVYFGYTNCPDVCPITLSVMADAMEKLEGAARQVVPIFITVDPARDTPGVMKDYLSSFGSRFIGLTGSPASIAAAAKAYRVTYKAHAPVDGAYAVDHSNAIYLMGPNGKFLASFDDTIGPEELAAAVMKQM